MVMINKKLLLETLREITSEKGISLQSEKAIRISEDAINKVMDNLFKAKDTYDQLLSDGISTEEIERLLNERGYPSKEELSVPLIEYFNIVLNFTVTLKQALEEQRKKSLTFAFPSHSADIMFTLLALFSGKPEMIPRKLLNKPLSERTSEEQKEAEEFLNSIFTHTPRYSYNERGEEIEDTETVALITDSPKVKADAKIDRNLFAFDEKINEESLAFHIKKTYGAFGLRHLLALIIGLEDHGRTGTFMWKVNEHLDRMGIRRKSGGEFDPEDKRTAVEVLRIFTSLQITAQKKDKKSGKEVISFKRLFTYDGGFIEKLHDKVTNQGIEIRATDFWYKHAFEPPDGSAPQYTKLLRQIAKENHRYRPYAILLTPLLALWWRMSQTRKLTVKNLMDWCSLDYSHKNTHRMRDLRDIETELNYMKDQGYLGEWQNEGKDPLPSNCENPFDCVLTLNPPEWLKEELDAIELKAKQKRPELLPNTSLMTREDFQAVFQKTGLSQRQFANNLGVSASMVGWVLNGKRKMTKKISNKVRVTYPDLCP